MKLSEDVNGKNVPDRYPSDHWRVDIPTIYPPFLHAPMGAQAVFVIYEPGTGFPHPLEGTYFHDGIINI